MESTAYQNLPISFVTTDMQGKILHFNPWASQLLNVEVNEFIQNYFFEEDARMLIETMQSSELIFGEVLRFESSVNSILHMRCTSIQEGNYLTWMFEHVSDLVSLKERLDSLKVLPRTFGHEINNFLTVIGSAAESIQSETTSDWVREDAESILMMTQRAATLTRQFMNLGRKSLLPKEVVDVHQVLLTHQETLQRLLGVEVLSIQSTEESTQVFGSEWGLRNILIHMAMAFQQSTVNIYIDVEVISYHFAHKVFGQPAGEYVILSFCEDGFAYSIDTILSTRFTTSLDSNELQGMWESVTRFRGGICTHILPDKSKSVTIFLPWVRVQTDEQ